MKLGDTNQFMKDNLDGFIRGDFDDKFDSSVIERIIELSFLLNHIEVLESSSILFKYEKVSIKLNLHDFASTGISEETVIHLIKS